MIYGLIALMLLALIARALGYRRGARAFSGAARLTVFLIIVFMAGFTLYLGKFFQWLGG